MVALALVVSMEIPWPAAMAQASTTTETASSTAPRSCLDDPTLPRVVPSTTRVAIIQPIFTATPYSQYIYGSFYAFYHKYAKQSGNITTDLKWLNTTVTSGRGFNFGWGHSYPLYAFLKSKKAQNCGFVLGKNAAVVSDINVTLGAMFNANGTARYDAAVMGFAEYVTLQEYSQLKQFVASGGRLVIMGADSMQVWVKYNPANGYETYVIGHGFAYNGKTAWRTDPKIYWNGAFDNANFVGSTDCCFHNGSFTGAVVNQTNAIGGALASVFGNTVFKSYASHEDNAIRNSSHTSVIATFHRGTSTVVASYVHQYRKGTVVCLCVFGDDIIANDASAQYFAMLAVGTPPSVLTNGPPPGQVSNVLVGAVAVVVAVAAVSGVFFLLGRRRGG